MTPVDDRELFEDLGLGDYYQDEPEGPRFVAVDHARPCGVFEPVSLPQHDEADLAQAWFDRILRADFTGARTEDPVLHGFSHYRLLIQPLRITGVSLRDAVGDNADLRWASRAELSAIGLPAPVRRLLERTSPEKE